MPRTQIFLSDAEIGSMIEGVMQYNGYEVVDGGIAIMDDGVMVTVETSAIRIRTEPENTAHDRVQSYTDSILASMRKRHEQSANQNADRR